MDPEQQEYVTFARLAVCQNTVGHAMDRLLEAGLLKEWNAYLPMYWMLIQTRLSFERRVVKLVEVHKAKDPTWELTLYDVAVSQP